MTESVHVARQGRVGRITLDRPQALNALNFEMITSIAAALEAWRDDPAVHAVVVEGAGRAFCAGGDVRALREAALAQHTDSIERFFTREYALNQAIADYPKPYIALIGGLCMGGGIGISVHGSARIVTPDAMFAMPETAIGFFPDIGATHVLPRLRGRIGMWMALTGARLNGVDAAYAGLATHVTTADRLATLADEIAQDGPAVLADLGPSPPSRLSDLRADIDAAFDPSGGVAGVIGQLESLNGAWAAEALADIRRLSPSAVFWSHRIVSEGAGRTLPQCLAAERALTRRVTRHPDFAEGVRAMVVDKDRKPRWAPVTIEAVEPEAIDRMFSP